MTAPLDYPLDGDEPEPTRQTVKAAIFLGGMILGLFIGLIL
jgi:hypothetical protein